MNINYSNSNQRPLDQNFVNNNFSNCFVTFNFNYPPSGANPAPASQQNLQTRAQTTTMALETLGGQPEMRPLLQPPRTIEPEHTHHFTHLQNTLFMAPNAPTLPSRLPSIYSLMNPSPLTLAPLYSIPSRELTEEAPLTQGIATPVISTPSVIQRKTPRRNVSVKPKKTTEVAQNALRTGAAIKKRGRQPIDKSKYSCEGCEIKGDETPQWRSGPNGKNTLCNACGLFYKRHDMLPQQPANPQNNNG